MTVRFANVPRWTDEDEQALQQFSIEWLHMFDSSLKPGRTPFDATKSFYTGYDPSAYKEGTSLPPGPVEKAKVFERIKAVNSSMKPNEEPIAFPLAPYYKQLITPMPFEIQQLSLTHNLYLLCYGFDLEPAKGEQIVKVILRLKYPAGTSFLTYSMSPDTDIEQTTLAHAKVVLGLDPTLKFRIPEIAPAPGIKVGGGVSVGADIGVLLKWEYRVLKAKVIATGVLTGGAKWEMVREGLLGSVPVWAVIRAPKRSRTLRISVDGWFQVKKNVLHWLRSREVDVAPATVTATLLSPEKSLALTARG